MKIKIACLTAVLLSVHLTAAGAGSPPPRCQGKVATFVGSNERDRFSADEIERGAVLVLRGGNDKVEGIEKNNVVICAGRGDDYVNAAGPNTRTTIVGGAGRDFIGDNADPDFVESGKLRLLGGEGKDKLIGGGRDSILLGGPGGDRLSGWTGNDMIRGNNGDDRIAGWLGSDWMGGGRGADVLDGDPPTSWGPSSPDVASGGPKKDRCAAEEKRSCELPLR